MLLGSITTERAGSRDQSERVFCIACRTREKEIKEKRKRKRKRKKNRSRRKQGLEIGVDIDGCRKQSWSVTRDWGDYKSASTISNILYTPRLIIVV